MTLSFRQGEGSVFRNRLVGCEPRGHQLDPRLDSRVFGLLPQGKGQLGLGVGWNAGTDCHRALAWMMAG